jgi:hypothetical protein
MKSQLMSILAALLALSAATVQAQSSDPPDYLYDFGFPRNGLSSKDEAFVLYADNCGRPHVDPTRAATVLREETGWVVDIYLVAVEDEVCLAVLAPDTVLAVSLGNLPKGWHQVQRRLHVRPSGAGPHQYQLLYSNWSGFTVGDTPNPALSGAWYDPAVPGTGLFINLLPTMQGEFDPRVVVYLANLDPTGRPTWSTGIGQFIDGAMRVELREGGVAGGVRTMTFAYQGCGKAQMSFADAPARVANLSQLTTVNGLDSCNPPKLWMRY